MPVAAARGLSASFCPWRTFCFTGTGRFTRRGVFPHCRRNPLAARVLSGYSRNAGKRAVSSDFRVDYHIIRCMLICYARCFTYLIRVAAGEAHRPAGVLPNRYDSTEYKIIKACSFFFEETTFFVSPFSPPRSGFRKAAHPKRGRKKDLPELFSGRSFLHRAGERC